MKESKLQSVLAYTFLILVLLVTLFPLVYTLACSFKSNSEIMAHPEIIFTKTPTLDNYKLCWTSPDFNVPLLLRNSIVYTLASVFISVMIACTSGYVFAKGHFKGKKIIFACFLSLMFIKTGGIGIYATFNVLNFFHIPQSLYSLLLIALFGVPVSNMYLVRGNIESLPAAIDEAAKVDGASFPVIFFKVIFPLLKPIIATIAILGFQGSWNDYLMPTIFTLTRPTQRTLIVGLMALKNSAGAATSWNLMFAGSVIALIPVLFAYGFANKYFVSGIAAGAVKG